MLQAGRAGLVVVCAGAYVYVEQGGLSWWYVCNHVAMGGACV